MLKTLEWKIQAAITRWLRVHRITHNKLLNLTYAGWPDLVAVKNGITYYFEVKKPGGKTTRLQNVVIEALNRDRQIAFVVKSLEEFIKIWEELPCSLETTSKMP